MTTIIDIHTKDGHTISGRADFGKGSPANPMTYEEVAEKFYGCCTFAKWPKKKADALVDMVAKIEKLAAISELTKLASR
jgi:2-methylcitrate dehydratase PrpD